MTYQVEIRGLKERTFSCTSPDFRAADLRAFAAKKQKVAKLLIESDLPEETEPHQQAAEKALAEVERIESGESLP